MQNHNGTINKQTSEAFFKKYTSHFICNVCAWEGVVDRTELQYIDPPLLWPSALYLSRSPGLLNRRPRGPSLCWWWLSLLHLITNGSPKLLGAPRAPSAGSCFHCHILSATSLDPNSIWFPVLTELYNSSTPTQSPTQSLEWHVWSSSSGNSCHAVQRSLSSGASVYECIMSFLPCPISSAKSAHAISFDSTGHWNVSHPSGASLWMDFLAGSKVKIQQKKTLNLNWLKTA